MKATQRENCDATVQCIPSNPCVYCRLDWFHQTVDSLKLSDPADQEIYEEAKKHLNPHKYNWITPLHQRMISQLDAGVELGPLAVGR